jgi:hypothetical protein
MHTCVCYKSPLMNIHTHNYSVFDRGYSLDEGQARSVFYLSQSVNLIGWLMTVAGCISNSAHTALEKQQLWVQPSSIFIRYSAQPTRRDAINNCGSCTFDSTVYLPFILASEWYRVHCLSWRIQVDFHCSQPGCAKRGSGHDITRFSWRIQVDFHCSPRHSLQII